MRSTLSTFDPLAEMRTMDNFFERMFNEPLFSLPSYTVPTYSWTPVTTTMPIAIYEKDNKVVVRASVPGIDPKDIDISIDNNVLTIRGEAKEENKYEDAKVYRREYSYGNFSRSIRLPEQLDVDHIDAEFKNGFVTVSIPSLAEPKSKAIKVPLKAALPSHPAEKASVK